MSNQDPSRKVDQFVFNQNLPSGVLLRVTAPQTKAFADLSESGDVSFSRDFTEDESARALIGDLMVRTWHLMRIASSTQAWFNTPQYRGLIKSVGEYFSLFTPPPKVETTG